MSYHQESWRWRGASRPWISSLPVEVKQMIAGFAKHQDEAFHEMKTGRYLEDEEWNQINAVAGGEGSMFGRSLGALFRTEKAFSYACAPLLFESVWYKGAVQPHFIYQIAPKYKQHFRTLKLLTSTDTPPSLSDLKMLLAMSHLLPFVNLEIDAAFVPFLLPTISTNLDDPFVISFKALTSRLPRLRLVDIPPIDLVKLLPIFPHISHLDIASETSEDTLDFSSRTDLMPALGKLLSLTHLSFTSKRNGSYFQAPFRCFSICYPQPPALVFVAFDLHSAEPTDWAFLTGFSSIETLQIDIGYWTTPHLSPWSITLYDDNRLANLRSLRLGGSWRTVFNELLPSFKSLSLETLELCIRPDPGAQERKPIGDWVRRLDFRKSLKEFRVTQMEPFGRDVDYSFSNMWHSMNKKRRVCEFKEVPNMRWTYFSRHPESNSTYDPEEERFVSLYEAKTFFDNLVEGILQNKDETKAKHVLKHLDSLRRLAVLEGM